MIIWDDSECGKDRICNGIATEAFEQDDSDSCPYLLDMFHSHKYGPSFCPSIIPREYSGNTTKTASPGLPPVPFPFRACYDSCFGIFTGTSQMYGCHRLPSTLT